MKQCKITTTNSLARDAPRISPSPWLGRIPVCGHKLLQIESNVFEATNRINQAPREVVDQFGKVEITCGRASRTDCGPYEFHVTSSWRKKAESAEEALKSAFTPALVTYLQRCLDCPNARARNQTEFAALERQKKKLRRDEEAPKEEQKRRRTERS